MRGERGALGRVTGFRLPGGSDNGLYEPLHPVAHGL